MVGQEVTNAVGEVVEGVEVWGQYPSVCGIRVLAATQVSSPKWGVRLLELGWVKYSRGCTPQQTP